MNHKPSAKLSPWPKQTAIVITSEQNLVSIMRNLLLPLGWKVIGHYPTVVGAAFAIREGRAELVIADDLPDQPITATLRFFLTHPVTVCTPIVALYGNRDEKELQYLKSLGRPQFAQKPVTASHLRVGFEGLRHEWETEDMTRLRHASYLMQKGDMQGGIIALKQLLGAPLAGPLAAQALAIQLRHIGKLKEAEALMLACLKKNPINLATICGLVDLYLNVSMPHLARKLLNATISRIQPSLALYPDAIQTSLLLGDFQDAITSLHILLQAGYNVEETTQFLARALFATGREKEAALLLTRNKAFLVKHQKSWQIADLIPLPATG